MLDAVYLDTVEDKSIVAMRPRLAFLPYLRLQPPAWEVKWCLSAKVNCLWPLGAQGRPIRVSGGDGGSRTIPETWAGGSDSGVMARNENRCL